MDDGTGVIQCRVNKNSSETEKIKQLKADLQHDSSIMVYWYPTEYDIHQYGCFNCPIFNLINLAHFKSRR